MHIPETALPLSEIFKLHPTIERKTIYKATQNLPAVAREPNTQNARNSLYLPSVVAKRLRPLYEAIEPDCFMYTVGKRTYIALETLPDECDICEGTARNWARKG